MRRPRDACVTDFRRFDRPTPIELSAVPLASKRLQSLPDAAESNTCRAAKTPAFWPFILHVSPETITTTAMLHEELPLAVKNELDVQGLNGVPVLLSTSTDLSLSGSPRRHWIVATHLNVAAVAEH